MMLVQCRFMASVKNMLHVLVRLRGGAPPVASLDVLAELLAAAERRALDVDGRCLLCCARYGKDKWGDEWHSDAQPHQKAEAWARRQLDGGYLLGNWCVPCGLSVASSGSFGNASSSAEVGRPLPVQVASKNGWTEVFTPDGYAGNSVDGYFLLDSF